MGIRLAGIPTHVRVAVVTKRDGGEILFNEVMTPTPVCRANQTSSEPRTIGVPDLPEVFIVRARLPGVLPAEKMVTLYEVERTVYLPMFLDHVYSVEQDPSEQVANKRWALALRDSEDQRRWFLDRVALATNTVQVHDAEVIAVGRMGEVFNRPVVRVYLEERRRRMDQTEMERCSCSIGLPTRTATDDRTA